MDDKSRMNGNNDGDLKDISLHFEKMSNAIHHFTEVYKENTHRLPFWKTKSFWQLIVVVSSLAIGLSTLYYTGKDALSLMKAYDVQKQINRIQSFKAYENKAIDTARVTVINQTIDCPTDDTKKLRAMKQARNNALINIISYNSGLNVQQDKTIQAILRDVVAKIYGLKLHEICEINAEMFDRKIQRNVVKLNEIVNRILANLEKQIAELKF